MRVKDLMTAHPACCTPQTTLREAAQIMCGTDCGAIPVVDADNKKKPVGIITDRDIVCRAVAQGVSPDRINVADCMSHPLATIHEESSIEDCCDAMESAQVRRMLVVNDDGELCGIVSQADLALRLDEEYTGEVVREVSRPTREASLVL